MKKILLNIILTISIIFIWNSCLAWNIDFGWAWKATEKFSEVSIKPKSWDFETQLSTTTKNVFKTLKIIIWALLVAYMVYAWVIMILEWADEKKISDAKKSTWYAIIWLLFINIPWTLYDAFSWKKTTDDISATVWSTETIYSRNIFMNSEVFWPVLWNIVLFLEIAIIWFTIFMFVYAWVKLILSWWDEEKMKEWKNKILYSLLALVFLWIMETWRNFIFKWDFTWQWKDLFTSLANLALFFAWPTAIFFLSLAWYYYITAAGDEEKVKKSKNIIINTVFATLILLWMYTILLDLKTLTF